MPRESQSLTVAVCRRLHFPLKEALPQRDWMQSPRRLCIQLGTHPATAIFGQRSPFFFRAYAIADSELPVPI